MASRPLSSRRAAVVPRALTALLLVTVALASPRRAVPAENDCVVVEDFRAGKVGQFPPGWKARKKAGTRVYSIQEENGLRFLRAVSRGLGIQAGKKLEWDVAAYPVLAWSWRVREFPKGADERDPARNDSAVSVYAVFPLSTFAAKALKYIWSERVPAGEHLTSNHGLTQVRVLRSGVAGKGEWVEERVNVAEDYRRNFGNGSAKPEGIAVLTDSDDTRSEASGDYANFRVCRS